MTNHPPLAILKRGAVISFSAETLLPFSGERARRIASRTETPPTEEQRAQHARAVELLAELEQNPYFDIGHDEEPFIRDLCPKVEIVYAETHAEWVERIKAMNA